jgi:hypothetical protein
MTTNLATNIICFLAIKPELLFYNFCIDLKNDNPNIDIYVFVDDNTYEIPILDERIKIIK